MQRGIVKQSRVSRLIGRESKEYIEYFGVITSVIVLTPGHGFSSGFFINEPKGGSYD
jgi:hypothetical protein